MVTIFPPNPKPWHSTFPTSTKTKTLQSKIVSTLNNSNNETKQSSAGKIKREVLTKEGRTKLNTYSDRDFYAYPRFVTHVDDGFISTLTNLYRQRLRPGSEVLDLMSSWVSHLPQEVLYKRVVGHGLNAQELAKNPRLEYFIVKDLNQDQKLEFDDCSFDAVVCAVSVQYLQQPEKVTIWCLFCHYRPHHFESITFYLVSSTVETCLYVCILLPFILTSLSFWSNNFSKMTLV